jgi:hypothetical protein
VDHDAISSIATGDKLGGTGNNNGNFTGQVYTVDQTPPTVTLTSGVGAYTNAVFTVTAAFSEAVPSFVAGNVTVTNGSVSAFTNTGGNNYSWTVTPTAQGAVTCKINASATTDAAGNGNVASNTISTTYNTTPPTVTAVTVVNGLHVDVTFSKVMVGGAGVTTVANYAVSGTGKGTLATHPASIALVSDGNNNKYRLT